jgi:hypothetical protein
LRPEDVSHPLAAESGTDAPRVTEITFPQGATDKWNDEQREFLHQRIRLWPDFENRSLAWAHVSPLIPGG